MTDRAVFVGGHSRTGTTLVQGLICNHPETISNTREASYFRALVEAFELGQRWFTIHTCDYFDDRESFTDFHRKLITPYFEHLRARFGNGAEQVVVQKEPRMTEFFPEVAQLLPEAKFIVMVRDLRDIVASQLVRAQKKGARYTPEEDIKRYLRTLARLTNQYDALKERLMFVWYEGLVNRPGEVMNEIWDFCDLPEVATGGSTTWTAKRPSTDESASELDGAPPVADPIGKNRHALDAEMTATVNEVRGVVQGRLRFDPFAPEAVQSSGKSTFFLKDIIRPA